MPVAAVTDMTSGTVRPVRLFGEDLVLYRDRDQNLGLIERHCAHRSADLSYGFVESCGIRCAYHGWKFDDRGRCTEQPYEEIAAPEAGFKERTALRAYPTQLRAGLVWAYLGPDPAPLVPDWEPFSWENGFRQIVFAHIPCNWFQCQENSVDPVHFEWLHMNQDRYAADPEGPYSPRHMDLTFEEFDYGLVYKRFREGMGADNPLWRVGRVCLWPNALFTGDHFEWRVPIDDENTLSVTWAFTRVPKDREPYVQKEIPAWEGPVSEPNGSRWISTHVMNQDFVAWMGQGRIADREREHLGKSDAGILMLRRRFLEDLERVARGEDPKAVIRDPKLNRSIRLPVADRRALIEGLEREEMLRHPFLASWLTDGYRFQAGQPESVRKLYDEAMGIGNPPA
jgi:5,5'-dehydrodivanillate O-demethylase